MSKRPWGEFADCKSESFVADLVENARTITPDDLCNMATYKKDQRRKACGGADPLVIRVAYAQDELIYTEDGTLDIESDEEIYSKLPRKARLNKFGMAYRKGAPLLMHKTLADITINAAIHLFNTQSWRTVLYDSLRTMEGAYKLYVFAPDSDITKGLLAMPGESAHNKGLAVDSMMEAVDSGKETDMGAHFDHLDMTINSRAYMGDKISDEAKQNRIIREAAFLRGALTQGLLIAPLRTEFWDDRLPENRADLWRVLDSAARCLGIEFMTSHNTHLRKAWETWSYADFQEQWGKIFSGREADLEQMLGVTSPPETEKAAMYHGNYHPIYDTQLVDAGKHLTDIKAAA